MPVSGNEDQRAPQTPKGRADGGLREVEAKGCFRSGSEASPCTEPLTGPAHPSSVTARQRPTCRPSCGLRARRTSSSSYPWTGRVVRRRVSPTPHARVLDSAVAALPRRRCCLFAVGCPPTASPWSSAPHSIPCGMAPARPLRQTRGLRGPNVSSPTSTHPGGLAVVADPRSALRESLAVLRGVHHRRYRARVKRHSAPHRAVLTPSKWSNIRPTCSRPFKGCLSLRGDVRVHRSRSSGVASPAGDLRTGGMTFTASSPTRWAQPRPPGLPGFRPRVQDGAPSPHTGVRPG